MLGDNTPARQALQDFEDAMYFFDGDLSKVYEAIKKKEKEQETYIRVIWERFEMARRYKKELV